MEPNEIMEQLSVFGQDKPVPREALAEAARQKEALTPLLLGRLDWLWENVQARGNEICGEPEYNQGWYAFFLLAQFREKRAYPKLIRLLRLDEALLEIAFGDEVCNAGNLLYSTYDGDLEAAMSLAADDSLDPFARNAALNLMCGLAADGRMTRETLASFIRERLAAIGDGEHEELFAAFLANLTADAGLFELTEDFRRAYRQEKVDRTFLGDFDGFLDMLFDGPKHHEQTRYIEDAATELAGWACFEREKPSQPDILEIRSWKVGRNDPCPCGSGKKFKKCCPPTLEEWGLEMKPYEERERDAYPPLTGRNGRPGLAELYSRDAIAVDEPAYRALKLLHGPLFRSRAEDRQAKRQARDLLWNAFQKTRRICAEQGIRTLEEFDEKYHIHYDCAQWLEPLSELLDNEEPRRREVTAFLGGQVGGI